MRIRDFHQSYAHDEAIWQTPTSRLWLAALFIALVLFPFTANGYIVGLACVLGIDRRTVAAHLQARGIERRINRRKMTDDDVEEAARRYRAGDSLATIASTFNVDAATIREELHRIGVTIRPRRGWS